jgi:hypothetical protein
VFLHAPTPGQAIKGMFAIKSADLKRIQASMLEWKKK